jgi:alanyl-tRNA synthetase
MKAQELKEKFLSFFEKRGHKIIPSAPLVPVDDPTSLFISAGMQPLVPYLLGEPHPLGKRLANVQKCLRTDDIDEVGDNRHLTFMEMLGNWSLGDYFKKEQLGWAFEFLTSKEWLGLDPRRLYISVFEGDRDAPRDEESIAIWQDIFKRLGLSFKVGERIFLYPKEKNWWGPVGEVGPCGPDSEIFYDTKKPHKEKFGKKCHINCDCGRYIETWNNVFMEYNKTKEGKYEKLKQKNVDTGLGFERVAAILQNKDTMYETELFSGIVQKIEKLSGKSYGDSEEITYSMRIIADHLRAAVFLVADGIIPSNKERGYVLRRLIRRVTVKTVQLNIPSLRKFIPEVCQQIIDIYKDPYFIEINPSYEIYPIIGAEADDFIPLLQRGTKLLQTQPVTGKFLFDLHQTYGFPLELAQDLLSQWGKPISKKVRDEFGEERQRHQGISRRGVGKKFAGGLVERGFETTKLHTATHLFQAVLRQILGKHVQQKGSNITPERLRFDFSHPKKLTEEELKQVEDLVNQKIREDLPVRMEVMSFKEAQRQEALALFAQKYGDKVKVCSIGSYSKEVCGGPHVNSTGKIGGVKIIKSKSLGVGLQRVYAKLVA